MVYILTRHDEDVPVLLAVVGPVAAGAVAYREARRLLANLLILPLVLVNLRYRVLLALLLQPRRQLRDREPRRAAHDELLQRVVHEFVLILWGWDQDLVFD